MLYYAAIFENLKELGQTNLSEFISVYVEFPGSVEYRNDETMKTVDKSNAETQTESRSEYCPKVRRTLPK